MRRRSGVFKSAGLGTLFLFVLSYAAGNRWLFCVFMGLLGCICGCLLPIVLERRRKKQMTRMITMDMAAYLTSVSLLMTAGLTLWGALRRALEGIDCKRPLFREISAAFDAYDHGNTLDQVEAFETMSARLSIPAMSTFVCALVQNYKKGSDEVATLFMELAGRCRDERRTLAGKMADEATTLLLLPAVIALVVMVMILVTPAILQLMEI